MPENVSFVGMGLAVDDQIFYAKDNTPYDALREALPWLPNREGDLLVPENPALLDEIAAKMGESGLFRADSRGINGMHVERNPGGGLNALHFVVSYAAVMGLDPVAGVFALGTRNGRYDDSAQYLIEGAQAAGIDMSNTVKIDGPTARTVAIVRKTEKGTLERTFCHHPGVAFMATPANYIEAMGGYKRVQATTWYYCNLGGNLDEMGGMGLNHLFAALDSRGILTVLDTAGSQVEMARKGYNGLLGFGVLDHTAVFAPGRDEISAIMGTRDAGDIAQQLYKKHPCLGFLVLKDGSNPTVAYTRANNWVRRVAERYNSAAESGDSPIQVDPVSGVTPKISVGTGDKALATAVLRLIAGQVRTPRDFLVSLNAGGAIAVSGQPLSRQTLEGFI